MVRSVSGGGGFQTRFFLIRMQGGALLVRPGSAGLAEDLSLERFCGVEAWRR